MDLAVAMLAALALHLLLFLPDAARQWITENLKNALIINVVLAIFSLLPLPPLDGGRIAVGVLSDALAKPLVRLEPYGDHSDCGVIHLAAVGCATRDRPQCRLAARPTFDQRHYRCNPLDDGEHLVMASIRVR